MKKLIYILFALALACPLTACREEPSVPSVTTQAITEAATEAPAPPEKKPVTQEEAVPFLDETVLLSADGVEIAATELRGGDEPALILEIRNNSDQPFGSLSTDRLAVNRYTISLFDYSEPVPAGETVEYPIELDRQLLNQLGIEEIAEIQLSLTSYGQGKWFFLEREFRLETSAAEGYDFSRNTYREALDGEFGGGEYGVRLIRKLDGPLFEAQDITVASAALVEDEEGMRQLWLEVQNRNRQKITLSYRGLQINGLYLNGIAGGPEIFGEGSCVWMISLDEFLRDSYNNAYGIDDYAVISGGLMAERWNSSWQKLFEGQPLSIEFPGVEGSFDRSGEELYHADGIRVVMKSMQTEFDTQIPIYAACLRLMVENETDAHLTAALPEDYPGMLGILTDVPANSCANLAVNYFISKMEDRTLADLGGIPLVFKDSKGKTVMEATIPLE